MSFIERSAGFPAAGAAAWPVCEVPVWRGGRSCPPAALSWWHPEAHLALDFRAGRYMRNNGELAADSVLSVTRSSQIRLSGEAGVYQTIDSNLLPRTDRGLYANGQIPALNANGSNPQSAIGWSNAGTPVIESAPDEGIFKPVYFSSPGSNSQRRINGIGSLTAGVTYGVKIRYDNNAPNPASQVRVTVQNTTASQFTILTGGFGSVAKSGTDTFGTVTIVRQDASGADLLISPASNGACNIGIGTGIENDSQVRILGVDATNTPFVPDAWVSTTSPAPTLLASDVRAVPGTRPSNGQNEPFPGWEAAGLDNGFSVLMDLESRARNPNGRRAIFFRAAEGNDCVMETNNSGGNLRLNVGTTVDNSFPGGQVGSRTRAAFRIMADGSKALAQKGSGTVNDTPTNGFGTMSQIIIGNQNSLSSPWNDWVYELQVCEPLTNEQLLAWVNA